MVKARPYRVVKVDKEMLAKHMMEILEVERICFGSTELWGEDNFKRELEGKWELSAIAYCGSKVVGFLIATRYDNIAHIHRIAVHKDYQRKGLGTKLIDFVERKARALSIKDITLEFDDRARRENVAAFYEKLRFIPLSLEETMQYLRRKDKINLKESYKIISHKGYRYVYHKNIGGE